jgi:uncharacterized protein
MKTLATVANAAGAPSYRRFRSAVGEHILAVPHSRIYDLRDTGVGIEPAELDALVKALIDTVALDEPRRELLDSVVSPAPQSISLNVSSSCNLSCAYCYAARGSFGGAQPQPMSWDIARAAIDSLLAQADPVAPITVGFLGGEPFVHRRLIHQSVRFATAEALERRLDLRFSVTTNGTLLREDDLELLRNHRFAVTVSIDGGVQTHERMRPLLNGQAGSHEKLHAAIAPLLREPGRAQVSARATVTRFDLNVTRAFDAILRLGFAEVGFAPIKSGPEGSGALRHADWSAYLQAMTALARRELQGALDSAPVRLTNFAVALKQLHRGACSPYPCGAGGGYFSVGANGDWYTCHRAIGEAAFRVGDSSAIDETRREQFLIQRHVHIQTDCNACWARYLCSGGCHQEAAQRTVPSCDFVRGWLDFCLAAYAELSERRPEFFAAQNPAYAASTA